MGRFEKNSSSYDTAHNARWDIWIPNCDCVDFLTNVCNMHHEPRIIPAGYIRSSRFDGPDVGF